MLTLLPCPFCGTAERDDEQERGLERWLQMTARSGMFKMECFGCGIEGRYFDTRDEAIEAWNRRWPADALRAGEITVNEVRAREGLAPIEEGDRIRVAGVQHIDCNGEFKVVKVERC